jgi:hypothetical protein
MEPVTALATGIVGRLLVPYFQKGAEKLAEAVGEELGTGVGQQVSTAAGKAWDLVTGAFTSDQEITTLNLFQDDPETFQEPVRRKLETRLKADPGLQQQLQAVLDAPGPNGTTSSIINNAQYAGILNLQGAVISNAQNSTFAGLVVGTPGAGMVTSPPGSAAAPPRSSTPKTPEERD